MEEISYDQFRIGVDTVGQSVPPSPISHIYNPTTHVRQGPRILLETSFLLPFNVGVNSHLQIVATILRACRSNSYISI